MHLYIYMYIRMYIYMYTYKYLYIYIYTYVNMYIFLCIQDGSELSKATNHLSQAEAAYRTLVEREATTWLYVENFQV
jgi:hypothetical protein